MTIMAEPPRTEPTETEGVSAPPVSMGKTVGHGAIWMVMATVMGKLATFIAQILLGFYLLPADWALYAYAASATKLLSICQDAGIKELLVQEGAGKYKKLSGPIFWFAATFNTGVAVFIGLAAPLVALWFDEPRMRQMMWVLMLAIPLGTPAAVLSTKLRLDLRFRATSVQVALIAIIRQFGQVAFAMAGAGAMSFIYPAVVSALLESILMWWISRDQPWTRPAEPRTWPSLVSRTKYLIFGSVANLLLDQGPYLVLQPALRLLGGMAKGQADNIQGHVYWAYQMTAQVGVLLSFNMQMVLAPVFQRLSSDPLRLRHSVLRSLSGLMLLGSITSIGFGLVMDPLEKMIFAGKWQDATHAVAIYGLFFPFRILHGLTSAAQLGTGRSAAFFVTTLIEGSMFTLSAILAGSMVTTASGAAWWTGGILAVTMICVTLWVLGGLGIPRRAAFVEMCWPWLLAVIAGSVGWLVDDAMPLRSMVTREWGYNAKNEYVLLSLVINETPGIWGWLVHSVRGHGLADSGVARLIELARFLITGTTCAVTFVLVSRFLMPEVLREVLRIMPGPLGRIGVKVLGIRDASN